MTRATGPWTLPDRWTRRRAHRSLENRADAVSHSAHRPFLCFERKEEKELQTSPYLTPLSLEGNTG